MAENNAKNYEGGTKGLGSVKTDVVSPALQKLTELSVKLRALTDNILEIKAKKAREEEERRAEEERRKEAEELLRIQTRRSQRRGCGSRSAASARKETRSGKDRTKTRRTNTHFHTRRQKTSSGPSAGTKSSARRRFQQ